VLDLTGSLYLGLRHASADLHGWDALTTGVPAALDQPDLAREVAAGLAALVGAERGLLYRSTLHAFLDLFSSWHDVAVLVDDASYPVARWSLAGRTCVGGPVALFPHRDVTGLSRRLTGVPPSLRPVVLTDGWCTGCARTAPIADYLRALRPYGGVLVLDDTQALGVLGDRPGPAAPYGHGGGGSARWTGANSVALVQVDSLAKGFGAPVALLAGSAGLVDEVGRRGPTRVHSSAPSAADLRAAEHALAVNARHGNRMRARLLWLVRRFRERLGARGTGMTAGEFPIQRLAPTSRQRAMAMQAELLRAGLRTVVTGSRCRPGVAVTVILTAALGAAHVDRAADLLAAAAARITEECAGLEAGS
jgi:8-amino-7-oxononanoate synthase